MILLLLAACSGEPATIPTTTPTPAPTAPKRTEDGTEGGEHAHGAPPHDGEVQTVGPVHLEAKFVDAGVMVWVLDHDMKPLDVVTYTGNATIQGPGGTQTVPLAQMGDHLHASAPLEKGKPASAVLSVPVDGQMRSVSFSTPAVGALAPHDHATLHGGVVSMWGDVHVEYAPQADEYRFYLSDADRTTIKQGVTGSVKDGDRTVALAFEPELGLLRGKGEGVGTRPVTLDATVDGKPFTIGFNAAKGSAAHEHGEKTGEDGHGH